VTRNRLLAYAAEIGAVSAVLDVAGRIVGLSDRWLSVSPAYKSADVLALIAAAVTIVAFFVAWAGFQSSERPTRLRGLSSAALLFAAAAAVATAADLIRTVESLSTDTPWKFTATTIAFAVGRIALLAAALFAAMALRGGDPDAGLGRASIGFALYAGFFAVAYGFELAEFLSFPYTPGLSPPWETYGGLGMIGGGWVVVAVGAVLAAAAFFDAAVRRARGDAWEAPREGMLGRAAIVAAAGFAVSGLGYLLFTRGRGTEPWLGSLSDFGLAAAAGCAAVAFLGSRRRLEQRHSSDLAVLPDPT
jgi:hypothetical protein